MMKRLGFILSVFAILSCSSYDRAGVARVREFISSNWDRTVHFNPRDTGTLIGMPYPYTVPSVTGMFQEMYYWDTYFTNEGLIRDGRAELARNNTDNMLYLVERFGMMPNGSRTWYLARSQPPFLSMMVRAVYEHTGDRQWLASAWPTLLKEYGFWQRERMTPAGLNRYSGAPDQALVDEFVITGGQRLGVDYSQMELSQEEHDAIGHHFVAEAESGWDFNPRFQRRCEDFCPIDLNSYLYMYEVNFAFFAGELGYHDQVAEWEGAALRRKNLMLECFHDPQSRMFYDWDFVGARRSDVISAAVFTLLYARVLDDEMAKDAVRALERLEYDFGVAVCEDKDYGYRYQWSFPNTWPPTTYLAIRGLDNYGYTDAAERIARKYVSMVVKTFDRTGNLWEKYNVLDGSINVSNEYEMPDMLGWSAGTFIYADEYLKNNRN